MIEKKILDLLQSRELAEAAYNSEWYDFSAKFSRNIILIMARSKRPIEVTAGKFFALSLSTFTGVSFNAIKIH